jgi:hypothetical protein
MGSLFKSKTKATPAPFEANPWKPQQQYLTSGFAAGRDALNSGLSQFGNIESLVAGMTPEQVSSLHGIMNTGTNDAGAMGNAMMNTGMSALGGFNQAQGSWQDLFNRAGQDQTGNILSSAAALSNNPHMQGMIDSTLGDVRRAFDRQVGEIDGAASGMGGINSTRAAHLESQALDNSQRMAADITANMRGAAWQQGLGQAMQMNQDSWRNQFASNQALQDGALSGAGLAAGGLDMKMQGLMQALTASSAFQQQNQAEIDGRVAQSQMPLDMVNKYMAAIGGNHGSQGFQTQITQQPSLFQQLAGGAAALGGMGWTPFCWVARAVFGEDNPEWERFRRWMFNRAPEWFFDAYVRRGERVAEVIHRNPWLKPILRPIMRFIMRKEP